jgi:PII-like signaling protein
MHSNEDNKSNLIILMINNQQMDFKLFNKNILKIYSTHNYKYLNKIQQANMLSKLNYKQQNGHNASIKEFWNGAVKNAEMSASNMVKLIKEIPVISEFKDSSDFEFIVKEKIFDFYLVITFSFFLLVSYL